MKEANWQGVPCYAMEAPNHFPKEGLFYFYDQEPAEVAIFQKMSRNWNILKREVRSINFIKKGYLIVSEGFVYGQQKKVKELEESVGETIEIAPLIESICSLVNQEVFTKEQGLARLLRHVSEEDASRLLEGHLVS